MSTVSSVRKPTQRDSFTELRALAEQAGRDDLVEFIDGRIAQLNKKTSAERKPTAKQVENEGIKAQIAAWFERDVLYASADVAKGCPACAELSPQRVSALLSQLHKSGVLAVTQEKRKNFYSLA